MSPDQVVALDLLLDDHFALWDFGDCLPAMRPDAVDSRTPLLIDMVKKGFVEITFGRWHENTTTSVPSQRAQTVLQDPASWKKTGQDAGYCIELTHAGRDALRKKGIGRPL
ncbi:hypothetical protein [Sphingomonas sp. MA1305]|uniref:hypothetical protein n=1 Tax=Sphingomonas sp. MA1305 TaxID=2479204 RepID=UPI0018DF9283|nr:hypothetical protein [Sphingomonas sp. MA1305]